ncbi:DNA primase, large subunit [Halorubrum distributum JCM 9100]|uniref:DNA primase large subunit PriL n=3 Tax=Halorubrum distributum TaxID=29283 RepID=M0EN03_9EURY|nr:DNA primase large subunit [Halorubrum distributum]ELZ49095.1 DNA primase, large subunit [Halorubrum distributum JCM 9100]ELZ52146.1 DNA primase, large subunit [Halorubrum distributum JCM 10118]
MDALDAKYPFFASAREAVAEAAVSLPELVAADAPAVERARERVERALLEGTVAAESGEFPGESASDTQAELLSYPIARILVSLLDSDPAIEKYAAAEAATAMERVRRDLETDDELRSVSSATVGLDDLLAEFDLADAVRPDATAPAGVRGAGTGATGAGRDPDHYRIDVGPYLRLTSPEWGDSWRLVNRALADGAVRVSREELLAALEAAVEARVAEGLPFELGADEEIAAALESRVADLRRLLSERTYAEPPDVVAPALFPPCMTNLIEKAERDAALSAAESFALMAFLVGIGMTPDEVVAFCADTSLDAEGIRYQTEFLTDDRGTQYPPPTCETLANYGICHNEDDHMQVAADPLSYYEKRVAAADDVTDWRDGREADGADEDSGVGREADGADEA